MRTLPKAKTRADADRARTRGMKKWALLLTKLALVHF